ncbi:hypothetical protein PHYPO_G00201050 [Pangasianodon hypophthalmus]|uniref:Uncharacterized protein n=1 Tax=Pangasianodon hypophthalmus TaxID=310915 RepID=A0A5N5PCP1_PANHP|nr:hypothetical protein PHYPO_G00201050 [Pangasianodon hypophthalmus]
MRTQVTAWHLKDLWPPIELLGCRHSALECPILSSWVIVLRGVLNTLAKFSVQGRICTSLLLHSVGAALRGHYFGVYW